MGGRGVQMEGMVLFLGPGSLSSSKTALLLQCLNDPSLEIHSLPTCVFICQAQISLESNIIDSKLAIEINS